MIKSRFFVFSQLLKSDSEVTLLVNNKGRTTVAVPGNFNCDQDMFLGSVPPDMKLHYANIIPRHADTSAMIGSLVANGIQRDLTALPVEREDNQFSSSTVSFSGKTRSLKGKISFSVYRKFKSMEKF